MSISILTGRARAGEDIQLRSDWPMDLALALALTV